MLLSVYGISVPSQKQLKWSQLRVGLTVVVASIILMVLIFLMSGTGGWFTSKIHLIAYIDNAGGLREGAPVRLSGVDIGNVTKVRINKDRPLTPVEIHMKVADTYAFALHKDSVAMLATAGVLEKLLSISTVRSRRVPQYKMEILCPPRSSPTFRM